MKSREGIKTPSVASLKRQIRNRLSHRVFLTTSTFQASLQLHLLNMKFSISTILMAAATAATALPNASEHTSYLHWLYLFHKLHLSCVQPVLTKLPTPPRPIFSTFSWPVTLPLQPLTTTSLAAPRSTNAQLIADSVPAAIPLLGARAAALATSIAQRSFRV